MGFKYTRNELAQLTGLSIETIKKRALKMGLKGCFKTINNREVIAYELSEQDLQDLSHAMGIEIPFQTSQPPLETPVKSPEMPINTVEVIDKIIDLNKQHLNDLKVYIERALYAEQQQKLIETSEANKDNEINRLNALVKQLQAENKALKLRKWWKLRK